MTSSFECMMSSLLQFRKIMAAAVVFLAMVMVAVGEYTVGETLRTCETRVHGRSYRCTLICVA